MGKEWVSTEKGRLGTCCCAYVVVAGARYI